MKKEVLRELFDKGYVSFYEGFDRWEDAVTAAAKPLVEAGAVSEKYVDAIIANVTQYGPYICIAPHICIPHAQGDNEETVFETTVCFMKSNKPVIFGDEEDQQSELLFVLASQNEEKHIQNLVGLMEVFEDEELIQQLLNMKTIGEFEKFLNS